MSDKMRGIENYNAKQKKSLRKNVMEALLLLIKTKSFDLISITDICKRAGVSRTGFYSNYKTKSDVLEEIFRELINDFNNEVGVLQHSYNDLNYYIKVFDFADKNSEKYKTLMDCNFEGKYLEIVNSIVINHEGLTENDKIRRIMWTGAVINTTTWWIYNDKKIPKKDMALWFYNFLENRKK